MTGFEVARARGLPPTLCVECAGDCKNQVALADSFPWPIKLPDRELPQMAFFCSPLCLLKLMGTNNCMGNA